MGDEEEEEEMRSAHEGRKGRSVHSNASSPLPKHAAYTYREAGDKGDAEMQGKYALRSCKLSFGLCVRAVSESD